MLGTRSHKRSDLVAAFKQARYQHSPDVAGCSGDEDISMGHTDGFTKTRNQLDSPE